MAIQTGGEITVDVDRGTAFTFVQDAQKLARCIPGCQDVQEVSPGRYTAVLTSRVAFMTLSFKVTVELVKVDPPNAIDARIAGDAVGLSGHVVATAGMLLAEQGPRSTRIKYTTDIALTGKLGGIGQPVFKATSAQLAREFGDNLKAAVEAEAAGAAPAAVQPVSVFALVRKLVAALWRRLSGRSPAASEHGT